MGYSYNVSLPSLTSSFHNLLSFAGDFGVREASVTLTEEEQQRAEAAFQETGFNVVLSDVLPMDRTIGDIRPYQ